MYREPMSKNQRSKLIKKQDIAAMKIQSGEIEQISFEVSQI
jgi:hypothetical protein